MARRTKPRPTGLTVKELPLSWFHRSLLNDAADQMRVMINACEHAILTGDLSGLKEGVNPIVLLQEQAELLGETKLLQRLDDEAKERANKK